MMDYASHAERDRRWAALRVAMREDGLDALVVAGSDFRGQKGGLRYVTDMQPFHRFGYAVLPVEGDPVAVLHPVLAYDTLSDWVSDKRFSPTPGSTLAQVIAAFPRHHRVGLVAMDQAMRVSDHAALVEALPMTRFVSADAMFERVRRFKSPAELVGVAEAATIADACFARLLDIARPGRTHLDVHAEMLRTATALGAVETLFLTMYSEKGPGGAVPRITAPAAREIAPDAPFCFSLELTGPSGHWVEFCRIVGFSGASAGEMAELCEASTTAGLRALNPGTVGREVQRALEEGVDPAFEVCPASGHAIGQDVIEQPMIVRGDPGEQTFEPGMVVALHPMIHSKLAGPLGYVADTFVMEAERPRQLSRFPRQAFMAL